jgi:hypothetical protein
MRNFLNDPDLDDPDRGSLWIRQIMPEARQPGFVLGQRNLAAPKHSRTVLIW